jgi:hypothetical protein
LLLFSTRMKPLKSRVWSSVKSVFYFPTLRCLSALLNFDIERPTCCDHPTQDSLLRGRTHQRTEKQSLWYDGEHEASTIPGKTALPWNVHRLWRQRSVVIAFNSLAPMRGFIRVE